MEPLPLNDEEFSNHGVSYDVLNDDVEFFDELMEYGKYIGRASKKTFFKIHQLPHVQNMAQTLVDIQKNFFGPGNNSALKEGCVAAASDVHGDSMSLLGILILSGAIIVDSENFVLIDIDTGEIYDTEEKINDAIQKLNDNKLTHIAKYDAEYDANNNIISRTPIYEKNRLIYLSRIEKNPNFKGKINILGDYFDRGNENLQNLAIIYYAKKLGINVNFILGNHEVLGAGGTATGAGPNKHIIINMLKKDILKPLYINGNTVWEHTFLTQENLPVMFNSIKNLLNNNMKFDNQDYNQAFETAQNLFANKLNLNENEDLRNNLSQLEKDLNSANFIFENLYEKNYAKLIQSLASMYNEPNFLNFMKENISTLNLALRNDNPRFWNENDINLINKSFEENESLRNIFFEELNKNEVWKNCILANCNFEKLYKILIEKYKFIDIDFFRLKNILIYSAVISDLHQYFNADSFRNFDDKDNYIIASMLIGKNDGNCGYLLAERSKGHFFKDIKQNHGHTPSDPHNVEIDNNNKLTNVDIAANYTFNPVDAKLNDNAKYSSLIGVTLFDESGNTEYFTYKAYRGKQNDNGFYELTTNNKENGVKFELQPPTEIEIEDIDLKNFSKKKYKLVPAHSILYNEDPEKKYEFNKQKILDNFYENNSIENDINASKSILPEPKVDDIDTNIDNNDVKGVSPQELKDAGLDMVYEKESQKATANYRLCDANVSQIDHVTSIASTVNKVYQDFNSEGGLSLKKKTHLFASDYHGDAVSMLGQLVFSKSFKIDPTKLVAVNIDKGIIYRTIDEIRTAKEKLDGGKLIHEDTYYYEDRKDRLVYLPFMEYIPNPEEEEEIELYLGGDYGDRGPESAVDYAILRCLQILKNEQGIKNVHVLAGNHEIETVCGNPSIMAPLFHKTYTYSSYSNITNDLFEKNFFEFCVTKETEKGLLVFSHAPHTICNLPAITLLTKTLLSNLENVKNEQFQNSIDDFRQSNQTLIQELEKNQPLYEKIKSLVKSEKINWEEFNFAFNRQTSPEADSSLKQASIDLYNEIQSANFTAKDIFDWINILGHATRNLQTLCPACDTFVNDEYSLIRNMLSATRSDSTPYGWSNLGWLVGKRLRDDFIDLLWKDVFLSIFGHTPDTDMAFDLNGQFLNTDVRLGTREGGDKSKDYSSINFTFVNEDGELFLTNYKVDRDKDKKVTGKFKKLPAKIKIKNNNEVKVINAPNEVEIIRPVEDKNEKDKPLSENNDNDNHDFHDDSGSDNNDNDNDSKPDAPKIKLQNPSPETPTDSNNENNNDIDSNNYNAKPGYPDNLPSTFSLDDDDDSLHKNNFLDEIKLNLGECIFIEQKKNYLINMIENDDKNLSQINKELDSLYKDCLFIHGTSKDSIDFYVSNFERSNFSTKVNILMIHKNEQIKLQSQCEKFSELISKSSLEELDKNDLLSIINHPKILFEEKLTFINKNLFYLYNNYLSNHGINSLKEKTPYLDIFEKFSVEDKFSTLNSYIKIEQENEFYKSISGSKKSNNEIENDIAEFKFSSFISKSKITEEEKTNAMEKFKKENSDTKKSIIDRIEKMEKQNEENFKAKNFRTLPLHKIPPLEPGDEIHI